MTVGFNIASSPQRGCTEQHLTKNTAPCKRTVRCSERERLQFCQSLFQVLGNLVGAAGGAGAAGGTLHAGYGILSLHALEQAADALEVAVAAADDLNGLDLCCPLAIASTVLFTAFRW